MSATSSISGMSGISNISHRTVVSEESSLVLEVLEPLRKGRRASTRAEHLGEVKVKGG